MHWKYRSGAEQNSELQIRDVGTHPILAII